MIIVNINGVEYQVNITPSLNLTVNNTKYPKVIRGDFFINGAVENTEGDLIFNITSGETKIAPDVEVVIDGTSLFYPYGIIITDPTVPDWTVEPSTDNITVDSFDITAQANVNGTVYAYLLPNGSSAPTKAEIIENAQQSFTESGAGGLLEFTGLTENTIYDVYLLAVDDYGNSSDIFPLEVTTASSITTYYVRPAGTTYGTGTGLSYANAWSGFANINQALLPNNILAICGTHAELFSFTVSDFTIVGNNPNESGLITGAALNRAMIINANNVTINNLNFSQAILDCLSFRAGIGNIVNNCIFNTSQNQTVQHEGLNINDVIEVTYNNCQFIGGLDDGVSLHGNNTTVTLNDCLFQNNVQGINAINTAVAILNRCEFTGNTTDVQPDTSSDFTLNDCILRGAVVANSSVNIKLNNCLLLSGDTSVSTLGGVLARKCRYENTSRVISQQTNVARVKFELCYFEVAITNKVNTLNLGCYSIRNSIFYINTGANTVALRQGNNTNRSSVDNCDIIGFNNFGWGVVGIGIDFRNTIFNDLNLAANPNGAGSITFSYCNVFDCTTKNINQNGGTFSETNAVTGNPLLVDVANLDFNLGIGSSCIGTGLTLTNPEAIDTANWGNGVNQAPIVTTANQGVNWNIGAYV